MNDWKTRHAGYYWVNLPSDGGWQPAQWIAQDWKERMGVWAVLDSDWSFDDEDFAEIGEEIIRTTKGEQQ